MLNKLIKVILILLILFSVGTAAFMIIEKWSFLESLYMTVITISTVGFQEVRPLTENGRIFTIFLILSGYGIMLYALSSIIAFIVGGELLDIFRRRKMNSKIEELNGHYIICGSKGPGEYVINELINTYQKFVVIENDAERIKELKEMEKILFVEGDASEDNILIEAGITRAKGLVSALSTDKDNLFVVLTARNINKDLRIVALAFDENTDHKLRRAGADSVITPNSIGGIRLASEVIRPSVVSFLDMMLRGKVTVRIEEVSIPKGSGLKGKNLAEAKIHEKAKLIIIAIRNGETGNYQYNPGSHTVIKEGDVLITIGTPEQVRTLREMVI